MTNPGATPAATAPLALSAESAVAGRRSVRGFTDRAVPRPLVERLLALASRAPSGTNMQPWKVHVVAGAAKEALSRDLRAAHDAEHAGDLSVQYKPEYQYYPSHWREPYLGRRRKVGYDMYAHLGIAKGDKDAMHAQHGRNFDFFGAPVGLFVTMDRDLERGSWLDAGMFIQNIMILARGWGLDTCPQAAFVRYHSIVRRHLGFPETEAVLSGLSLGYADPNEPANRLRTERAPVAEFATFTGF